MKSGEVSEVIINGTGGCEGQKRGSLWPLIDKACNRKVEMDRAIEVSGSEDDRDRLYK